MTSYKYRKSYCGDKTILWPSYPHSGISYTGEMTSLYWIGDQMIVITWWWQSSNCMDNWGLFNIKITLISMWKIPLQNKITLIGYPVPVIPLMGYDSHKYHMLFFYLHNEISYTSNTIVRIRQLQDWLISTMGFSIMVRQCLYIEKCKSVSILYAQHSSVTGKTRSIYCLGPCGCQDKIR